MLKTLFSVILAIALAGCAGTVTKTNLDGSVEEIPAKAYVAATASASKAECFKGMNQAAGSMTYTPEQVGALSASAQAKYFDYHAERERNAPLVEMAGTLKAAFGKQPCQDEAAIAFFDSEKEKYRQLGFATGKAFDLALIGWIAKMAKETVTGIADSSGDVYNTTANGNTITSGAGAASEFAAAPGGSTTVNFGGNQAAGGSTLVKGNGNVPYFLQDSTYQGNEKGTIGDGDINDNDGGNTSDGLI